MARPSDYRHGYRKNTRNRQKKENKFYTKPNNGGILNKRMPGIDEIRQNIEAEQARAQEYENEWLDSVVNNADEQQMNAAKARAQEAKSSVKSWNEKLSEAYGLGDDGYWNRGTSQPETQQSAQMKTNPAHAYGIVQFGTKAKLTTVPGAAGSAKGRQIMQLQDTLVHNPGMSDREKSQVQEKISSLTAEKKVLDWKDANPGTPTVESYEAQKSYYDRLWQQNQDAIVNGLGNGTLKQGSDEWYELFKKGDNLLAMKDAYNRGMMGLLDGDKAQTAEEQAAAGGGGRRISLDAKDGAVYTEQPGMDDGNKGTSTYISGEDFTEKLKRLNDTMEAKNKLAEYFNTKLSITSLDDPDYNTYIEGYNRNLDEVSNIMEQINALREQRGRSVYNDPIFNMTGIINDQNALGNMPYGSKGTASGNACGAVSVQNALTLLGEASNFADVYSYFNDDSKLNLGSMAGGELGTSPIAVMDYLKNQGHKTNISDFKVDSLEKPGTYILVYGWQNDSGKINAHYMTVTSDGSSVKTYNGDNEYFVGENNNTGNNNANQLLDIVEDNSMIQNSDNVLLNSIFKTDEISYVGMPFKNQLPQLIKNFISGDNVGYSWLIEIN